MHSLNVPLLCFHIWPDDGSLQPKHVAEFLTLITIYKIIHKFFRDIRPLRYSSRDGHAEGKHVNRGRDTPNFCPNLQVLDMLLSAVSVLVVAQRISEVPEGLMNYPVQRVSKRMTRIQIIISNNENVLQLQNKLKTIK